MILTVSVKKQRRSCYDKYDEFGSPGPLSIRTHWSSQSCNAIWILSSWTVTYNADYSDWLRLKRAQKCPFLNTPLQTHRDGYSRLMFPPGKTFWSVCPLLIQEFFQALYCTIKEVFQVLPHGQFIDKLRKSRILREFFKYKKFCICMSVNDLHQLNVIMISHCWFVFVKVEPGCTHSVCCWEDRENRHQWMVLSARGPQAS